MKKIFYILASLFITLFQLISWNAAQAQCSDAHGSIAFTGYQIADPVFTPQVDKDRFSFVVLDSIPKDTEFRFTDRGWTGSAFQAASLATTDGEFIWKASAGLPAGTHIVITLNGNSTSASVGTVSGYTGDFKIGLAGDQLFAYSSAPFKIHAAMLVNKAAWDTPEAIAIHGVPDFSSSASLNPNIAPRQSVIIANRQGSPAVDQENAFQAKLNPIILIGGRAALRTQLFAGTFTTQSTGTIDLTVSPITWNVALPTYTNLTLANKKLSVNGVTESCYYKWQKSTDGTTFTDITEGGAFTDTEKASLSINSALAQDTWFRVRLTGAKSTITTAIKLKALKINTQPVDRFACPASTVSFSVVAEGEGTLKYKWQQRTTPTGEFADIPNGGIFSGLTTNTLTLNSPSYSYNNYAYRCMVVDDLHGTITGNAATLTVSNLDASTTKVDVSCFGTATGSIDLTPTGGTAPYTFEWSDGVTTEDRINLSAGPYSVTVTDAKGCKVTKSITIGQPTSALSIATPSITHPSVYGGTNGSIQITVSGGTSGYTYQWFKGAGVTAIATTKDISTIGAGVYKVIVTDANGCQQVRDNIIVLNPNAKPELTTSTGSTTYTEGTAAVVDAGLVVADPDNTTLASATIAITGNFQSTQDVLGFTNNPATMGDIAGSYATGTGVLTLTSSNASATLVQWQSALRAVSYANTSQDPSLATRTISFKISDGSLESVAATKMVTVVAVNDAPTLTATGLTPTFTEGGAAVSLFSGTSISTVEAGQLIENFKFTVNNVLDGSNEIINIDGKDLRIQGGTTPTDINALMVAINLTGTNAVFTVSNQTGKSATVLQGIINGITYRNTSTNPNTANRVVTLSSIQDNGGTANGGVNTTSLSIVSTVSVVAVNNAPVVTTSGGNTTYSEGTAAVVDATLTVSDPDNTTLASAAVAITGNFQSTQDILSFANDGATMGNITAALYNNATGVLTLSSAGSSATLAQWQAALRAVKYDNSSQNPSTAVRTITFSVSDGSLGSVAATKTVSVVAVNDAPVASNDSYIINEDVTLTVPAPGILANDTDVDSNTLTAVIVAGSTNGTLTLNANGSFAYTPNANFNGTDSFTYRASDGSAQSNIATVTITVNAVNDAPVVTVPASIPVTEDITTALTSISFSDVDAGINAVTVTFSVPSGTMNATSSAEVTVTGSTSSLLSLTGSISNINTFIAAAAVKFTTASNATNNVLLTVSINDNGHTGGIALTDSKTTTLVVTAVNDEPVNSVPGAQSVDQDATLVFSTGNVNLISISDVDAGSGIVRVTLTATNGLMTLGSTNGISFESGSGVSDAIMTFEGTIANINTALNGLVFTPTPGYNGSASLQIITDDKGYSGSGGAKTDTDNIAITVNSISPKVISVSASTANGTYKIDDVIALTVNFDQTVVVNTGGGIPTLLLETGAIDREATYASGSGSSMLTFNYTVRAGDISADLDYTSPTALSLNGSTIKNIHNDVAILTLPTVGSSNSIAGQRAIVIDGLAPVVTSVTVPANGFYLLNQDMDFTVNFSEAVTVNTVGGTPRLVMDVAGHTVYAGYVSGSGTAAHVFRYQVQSGLQDLDGIAVGLLTLNGGVISDIAGNNAVLTLNSVASTSGVKIDSKNPQLTLSINGEATHTNSRSVNLTLHTTDTDLATMQFSSDNTTWTGEEPFAVTKSWNLTGTDGTKVLHVRVKDLAGNMTQVSGTITLDQTAPAVLGVAHNGLYKDDRTITFNEGNATLNNIVFTSGSTVTTDGTYTLVVTDAASNVTTVQFEIDKTAPIVSGVENGKFYNSNRTITFNEGTATLNGASFNLGDIVTAEGTYTLVVTDAATNATTVVFTIDKVAPVVLGVENGKTYNTDLTITFNEGEALLNGVLFASGTVVSVEGSYTLAVTDAAGNSTTVGFTIDKTAPAVPVDFVAVGQDKKIALAWTANAEPDFDKYLLYVKPEGAAKTLLATIPKGTNNYMYTGLPNGLAYDFFLIAVDQVGNQSAEAPASAKTMGEQSISFAALTNLTYGQQGVVLTASATSNLPVSFVSSDLSIAQVYQDNSDAGKWKINAKKVGTVTITATQAGNNEYLPAASVPQSLTIVPAILTVTADAKTKVYGEADPALTYMVKASDLRNGDAATVVSGSLTRAQGEAVGNYDITNVNLAASNYTINYVKSALNITKAALTVTADAKTKEYGMADPALTYTVKASDLRNGDAVSVVSGTLTREAGEAVGNYDITNVNLAASNYTINYVKSALRITKAALTVTADAKTKVYGEVDPALSYTVKASDLRNGDAAAVVSGTLTRAAGEVVGNYDISNVNLAASNYTINYVKSALRITKAALTVTADAKTKVYGEVDPALTFTVKASDLRNGDAVSVVSGSLERIVGENVGVYAINNKNLTTTNYNINYTPANLSITKATLTGLSFADRDVVYDGQLKSLSLAGTLPTGLTVAYSNNDKINAGSYEVTATIAETQNYFGTSFKATLLIRKAKQTISFTAPGMLTRDAGTVVLDVRNSSELPLTLIVDDPLIATVSGTNLQVHRLGTVMVTASQAGNENYEAAIPVTVPVRIAAEATAPLPILVHQAVSPNGDGLNEFLILEGIRDYPDNKVTIFDKNGVILAEIEGYDNRDRVFTGQSHRDGTYYYYIDVKDNGKWKREKGFFVIKR